MAFHAEDELLAVASGHKVVFFLPLKETLAIKYLIIFFINDMLQLHMWHYNGSGEESTPVVVLKTKRSLRAVHFHPHGAPFLMTAEVIDHFYLILGFLLNCLSAYISSELMWLAGE